MIAQKNLGRRQEQKKQYYDAHAAERELQVGDWVLVLLPDSPHKLFSRWQGSFWVMRCTGPVSYKVWSASMEMEPTRRKQIYHINLLNKWCQKKGWMMQDPVKLEERGTECSGKWGNPQLDPKQQETLGALITKFQNVFHKTPGEA